LTVSLPVFGWRLQRGRARAGAEFRPVRRRWGRTSLFNGPRPRGRGIQHPTAAGIAALALQRGAPARARNFERGCVGRVFCMGLQRAAPRGRGIIAAL